MDPIEPTIPPPSSSPSQIRLGGIRRGLATLALALGLLAVGGAAVVLAASPEPSASTTPSTQPATTPSTTDGSGSSTGRSGVPCPEGSDGQTPAASPSTGTSS